MLAQKEMDVDHTSSQKENDYEHNMKAAVVLIDFQVDYISGGDLIEGQVSTLLQNFPELPRNVSELLNRARDQSICVIHIRERDCEVKSTWLPWWDKLHPRDDSESCGLGKEALPEPWARDVDGEEVFIKHTYDAFQSGDVSREIEDYLRNNNIQRLYFAGVLTRACVMFTANSAFNLGFEVFVISDCCADRTREHHDMALQLYDGYHIKAVSLDEISMFPGGSS